MNTLYLIPSRKGVRIGDDVYTLLLDGDEVRHIYPEKLKEWTVETHCGHTGMKCVHCQKYIHNNIKFANLLLYLIYDAKTNVLSHKTNYLPFTGLSYRNNDDDDMIVLDRHFELPLHKGMFISFNLPSTSKTMRFGCSMDFYVGSFEEEAAIDADVEVDDDEEEDDDNMVDEEEDNNRSVVLLSDNDDDDDQPCLDLYIASIQPPLGPRTPCNVEEASRNPINNDDRGFYGDDDPNIASMAVQPPLHPTSPPQVDDVDALATPHRMPDPPGGTPLNFSSPLPTNASQPVSQGFCSHYMFNTFARLPEVEGGYADGIAHVLLQAELEETQAKLQAALDRNALLSPLEKGYQSLNSP